MSMHLEGPWLTTTGKIRSKRRKYASAEAARKDRELAQEWEQRQKQWAKMAPQFAKSALAEVTNKVRVGPQYPPGREPATHIPSKDSGIGFAAKLPDKVYTGTKIKGIGTMHKSNAVPIFSDEEAVDISRMRR